MENNSMLKLLPYVVNMIEKINTLGKVLIVLCLGLTTLVLLLGYRLIDYSDEVIIWNTQPKVVSISPPCVMYEVRFDTFTLTIPLTVPGDVKRDVNAYGTYYQLEGRPTLEAQEKLCLSLIDATLSDNAETRVRPYREQKQDEIYRLEHSEDQTVQ